MRKGLPKILPSKILCLSFVIGGGFECDLFKIPLIGRGEWPVGANLTRAPDIWFNLWEVGPGIDFMNDFFSENFLPKWKSRWVLKIRKIIFITKTQQLFHSGGNFLKKIVDKIETWSRHRSWLSLWNLRFLLRWFVYGRLCFA